MPPRILRYIFFFLLLLLFVYWRYNPLWVSAFSVILLRSVLSLLSFLRPLIPIDWISSSVSSVHLFLGLPLILLPVGFHSNTLLFLRYVVLHKSTNISRGTCCPHICVYSQFGLMLKFCVCRNLIKEHLSTVKSVAAYFIIFCTFYLYLRVCTYSV
jgi:hypothetical protein